MTAWQRADEALGGEYILVREAPQSAGFDVFEARSKSDGSNVVIKTVASSLFHNGHAPREAEITRRRLQHPNIIPVLDAGASGDVFYWISPAIDGRTLRARLSRGVRMHFKDSLIILRDISAGLTHAHLHGVVHGGLSPDSVTISGGSALISDAGIPEVFGALRDEGKNWQDAEAVEALRYSSPEEAAGTTADARSDVYSWGVIAYELLSGRHPFAGRSTPRQMMAAHSDEDPAPLAAGLQDVPAGVTRLVMRCLSKDPSQRPESARELFAVMTKEMLVPPPAPKAGTGQKVVITLLALAVLAIAVIAWLGMRA
jgi:serine/threonine-protein kinase